MINAGPKILRAAIDGNQALAEVLGVEISEQWTEFGASIFRYTLAKLASDPNSQVWWTYFVVHRSDQCLIGTCGYKGPPDQEAVEVGYEIAIDYRGRGLATELTGLLVKNAMQYQEVKRVQAHTLVGPNASTRVLEKSGLNRIEVLDTPEGRVWKWAYPA